MSKKIEIQPLDPRENLKRKRERLAIIALTLLFFVLLFIEFRITKVSSTLPFVNSIFFFGLVNINIIILILLLFLVIRNVGKLFLERRRNLLGAKLKTKLVISFLAFSIIPTIVLFIISALYINTTFDKWFSLKIQNTLQTSLDITRLYYKGADETTNHFAVHLSKLLSKKLSHGKHTNETLQAYLESQRELLALDYIEYYSDYLNDRVIAARDSEQMNFTIPRMSIETLEGGFSGKPNTVLHHTPTGDLVRAMVSVKALSNGSVNGVVVVSRYVPVTLTDKIDEISSVIEDYKDINPLKYPVKTAYLLILVMMTLMIIFVAIWIGLFIAKELVVPVERLVKGAQAVGAGNLDTVINSSGHDEISVLVDSFNKMTKDLKENRERLTEVTRGEEKRKIQLETILANVGTGVISTDQFKVIQTFNRAASEIFKLTVEETVGKKVEDIFKKELPMGNSGPIEMTMTIAGETKFLASTITEIPSGFVVVVDDVTHLVKGQREMAWSEVARRIAHEIKNPLTPIKLSAQRLQRRFADLRGKEGSLLKECTETIIQHTDELKEMVNEFSNFARLPEISTQMNNLGEMLKETVTLYSQAHPKTQIIYQPDPSLKDFQFDRDQLKRVFINLLDNAMTVLKNTSDAKVIIKSHYHAQLKMAVIEFKDNGEGMSEEVRSRVFEPYFSTKSEGTGLGLAIVKRIISDHHGFIRVQSQIGEGTSFVIELPVVVS